MIIGGYQFYFFVQRHHLGTPRLLPTFADDYIPFWPSWVWIYSGVYYPVIVALVFLQPDFASYNHTAFSYFVLLAMQCIVFVLFPVKIPARWRKYDKNGSLSLRMLGFVQSYDHVANSIPSMHVSVATLTAIHLHIGMQPALGNWALGAYGFPALISLSAVLTKQHYVFDLPPGAVFGWLAWKTTDCLLA